MKKLKIRVKKPWIAYPGSTIQQSYGEELDHGYLLWDIKDKNSFDVEFKRLDNPHPFVTIDWRGNVQDTVREARSYPDGSRFRVKSNTSISQVDIKQLHNELKTLKSAEEIIFKIDNTVDTSIINAGTISIFKDDLRDVNVHLKFMKEFFSDAEISDEEWLKLSELLRSYINVATVNDETTRNTKWGIEKLEFDNVFSYGKGNVINFSKLNGITGIFAPNRAGKSSIIGTLMYSLYNTTDRGPLKNLYVVNTRKGHCLSKVHINVNGSKYLIERQTVRHETKKGAQYAPTHLNLFKIDEKGNPVNELNGEQRKDTDKEIRRLIGTSDDFLLTSLSSQNDMNKFINEGSTTRRSILSKFLDLEVFDKINELAKNDSNTIKAQMKGMPDHDWDKVIDEKSALLQSMKDALSDAQSKVILERATLKDLQLELAGVGGSNIVTPADVQRCERKIQDVEYEIKSVEQRISSDKTELLSINEKLTKISSVKSQINIEELKSKLQEQKAVEKLFVEIKHQHEKELQILKQQEKSVLKLLDVPCGDQFPSCKYIKDSHNDKIKIEDQRTKVKELLEKISHIETSYNNLKKDNIEATIEKYTQVISKESDLKQEISKVTARIEKNELQVSNSSEKLVELNKQLIELKKNVNAQAANEISEIKSKISSVEDKIDDLDNQKMRLAQKVGGIDSEIKKLVVERERFNELRSRWRIYDMILAATNKKGIPAHIMRAQLPAINAEIQKILHGVVNFTIELAMEEDSNSMEIYIDYDGQKRVIELASGMEKMISSLAIRVALLTISSLPKTDMLIIDEGFGSLDESNIEACSRLLTSLKKNFKNILVISHIDAIKDIVDNILEISRDAKGVDAMVVYE